MTATLPLFSDLAESAAAQPTADQGVCSAAADSTEVDSTEVDRAKVDRARVDSGTDDGQRHLHAAWRLSRAMRRFRAGSAEETRVGLAICHHLQALLRQTSLPQSSGSHPSGHPS